jgi:hypothetical protein
MISLLPLASFIYNPFSYFCPHSHSTTAQSNASRIYRPALTKVYSIYLTANVSEPLKALTNVYLTGQVEMAASAPTKLFVTTNISHKYQAFRKRSQTVYLTGQVELASVPTKIFAATNNSHKYLST